MRIALAQINPTVGDLSGNTSRIIDQITHAKELAADCVVFPELSIVGYPPKDLLLKPALIDGALEAAHQIAEHCHGVTAVVGLPVRAQASRGRSLINAAAWLAQGQVKRIDGKRLLPTYDVFDELRYFESASQPDLMPLSVNQISDADPANEVCESKTWQLGLSICEDMWNDERVFPRPLYHQEPISDLVVAGADVVLNLAASPFVMGKHRFRLKLIQEVAKRHGRPVVYCNQVGGNDELVFDGGSCVVDGQGNLLAHAKRFEEDLLICDLPHQACEAKHLTGQSILGTPPRGWQAFVSQSKQGQVGPSQVNPLQPSQDDLDVNAQALAQADLADCYDALVLGTRDYIQKCGFKKVVIALSGGIDSALTAAVVVDAIGSDQVVGVSLPSRYSSDGSKTDAQVLAERLKIEFHTIPIEPAHDALEQMLQPVFEGLDPDVTEENIQARVRGNVMMALSNKLNALLVTTGNKSELAVGYCTLYGDMCGGLAVISDVPKTLVYALCRWINTPSEDNRLYQTFGQPVIPEETITKPPSAELRPDQVDQDSLPPYEVLDEIVERYVQAEQDAGSIVKQMGIDQDLVLRIVNLIDRNEYKRKQAAPGLKVTSRAFGFGRRMPIAQRFDNRKTLELV